MNYEFVPNLDLNLYQEFISNTSMTSFMQNANWALVKENWESFRPALYQNGKLVAACLLLIKKINSKLAMGYVPRGYVLDFENKEILEQFTQEIKKLAKQNHCYVVKLDPNFCISEKSILFFEKQQEIDIPIFFSKNYQKKHQNLIELGYIHKGYPKKISETIQPRFHMMIPLIDSNFKPLTEEQVLKSFKKRVRSYLGSYHEKRGVFYEHTSDIHQLDEFIEVLNATEERQKIHLRNKDYFLKIMENYKENAVLFFGKLDLKKYLEFLKNNNGNVTEILEVEKKIEEGISILTLSTALVIMPNNHGIAEYLYAGNRLLFHKLQVSLGLVYDICKYSIQHQISYCNLGGVDGSLEDHLSVYKSRFNSIVMEFIGEYDLPIHRLFYPIIDRFLPILKKIYRFFK